MTEQNAMHRLIEVLRQDERRLQLALTHIEADEDEGIMETWLQYSPE